MRNLRSCCFRGRFLFNQSRNKSIKGVISRGNATFISRGKNGNILLGLGVLGGVSLGVAYSLKTRFQQVACEEHEHPIATDNLGKPTITLYQYQTCPFCCKVRAYLEYYGLEYTKVEVNPLNRNEIKFSEYRKVPIAVVDGMQVNDSSVIISTLHSSRLTEQSPETILSFYPAMKYKDEKGKEKVEYTNRHAIMYLDRVDKEIQDKLMEERKWREWVDTTFVHTLSPNIYRTTAEAMQAFEYFSSVGNFAAWERYSVRYFGAFTMYILGKHLKTRYRLKDDVRESLYEEAEKWMKAVGKRKFMGGAAPNLADLAVYGVLSGLEGLDMHNDLLANTSIKPWYLRVKQAVKSHAGATVASTRDSM